MNRLLLTLRYCLRRYFFVDSHYDYRLSQERIIKYQNENKSLYFSIREMKLFCYCFNTYAEYHNCKYSNSCPLRALSILKDENTILIKIDPWKLKSIKSLFRYAFHKKVAAVLRFDFSKRTVVFARCSQWKDPYYFWDLKQVLQDFWGENNYKLIEIENII